jgi:hypothetical protein
MRHWFFLTDAKLFDLAKNMTGNALANSLVHTSKNTAVPLGVVFDYWNNDQDEKALDLLASLVNKLGVEALNSGANRLELYLLETLHLEVELITSFNQWLNKNGLSVVSQLAPTGS